VAEPGAARGEVRGKQLVAAAVDAGSPAWEAGLVEGDEVRLFAFDGRAVAGGPAAWLKRLQRPVPGREHYFEVRRDGRKYELLTTVRQRPLWRFAASRDGEWVLWMWRNSFYDTSARGDSLVGWHVNAPDLDREPAFYPAERYRKFFERPDVIDKLLQTRDVRAALRLVSDNPVPLRFDALEPPAARLDLDAALVRDGAVRATLIATPRGDNPDHQPRLAELWVNDHRFKTWEDVSAWERTAEGYRQAVAIPAELLRTGPNTLTFQTFNRLGGRSQATGVVHAERPLREPRLVGLAVGINDYSAVKPARGVRALGNLESATNDAAALHERLRSQERRRFAAAEVRLLRDAEASRPAILAALDNLAAEARAGQLGPDDCCVLFLAGHGVFAEFRRDPALLPRTEFVFCCPRFDPARPEETGLTSRLLADKLAALPCRKVVLLDACHAGEATTSLVRDLTPEGQGPVILAACDRSQFSYEYREPGRPAGNGVFTLALSEALGDRLAEAAGADGELTARELFAYTRGRVPELLKRLNLQEHQQVPALFVPPGDEQYPLAVAR
jgi:hypothetical protein